MLAMPALAWGQALEASQSAMFHFGPLAVTPRLAIQNLGVDTNVFLAPLNPIRDTTMSVLPGADVWLQVGRALISSKTTTDWLYYRQTATQRSFSYGEDLRVDIDLARVTPRVAGVYSNMRRRPNAEIDLRVQELRTGAEVGAMLHVASRVDADVDVRRTRYDYLQGTYGDAFVANALNRDSDEINLTGKFELTPLTSFAIRTDWIRDRFVYTPERDSDSVRVMPGVIFKPFALISGSAYVGVRRFMTISPDQPDYTGWVADVDLTYVAMDWFRLSGIVKRDVDYSLDSGRALLRHRHGGRAGDGGHRPQLGRRGPLQPWFPDVPAGGRPAAGPGRLRRPDRRRHRPPDW